MMIKPYRMLLPFLNRLNISSSFYAALFIFLAAHMLSCSDFSLLLCSSRIRVLFLVSVSDLAHNVLLCTFHFFVRYVRFGDAVRMCTCFRQRFIFHSRHSRFPSVMHSVIIPRYSYFIMTCWFVLIYHNDSGAHVFNTSATKFFPLCAHVIRAHLCHF
jgi:hypothetical protein